MNIPTCVTDTSREMIRLAHLAYDAPSVIQSELATGKYGLQGWTLAWGPVFADDLLGKIDNLCFVAQNDAGDLPELAVVIRGTTFDSVESWLDDLEIEREPWPYTNSGVTDAEVSKGLLEVFNQMTTETPSGDNHVGSNTLGQFLTGAGIGKIQVTGHSQGGATSSMMAAWVDWLLRREGQAEGLQVSPYTFAGETAGNAAFATDLNTRFEGTWRFVNEHDVVPRAWDNLVAINSIYEPKISTPLLIKGLVDVARLVVRDMGFTQPNLAGCSLPSQVTGERFLDEVEHQHSSATYIDIMGDMSSDLATESAGV